MSLTPEQERDFEIVRLGLNWRGSGSETPNRRDALSRLRSDLEAARAEVERLRDQRDRQGALTQEYADEVERLRAELEARPKVYFPVEETAREVDRLLKALDVAEKNTEDRQREVERLQGLVDDPRKLLKSSGLVQEAERLRAALERARDELGMVTPDYPAPIANAARIIHQALQP